MNYTLNNMLPVIRQDVEHGINQEIHKAKTCESRIEGVDLRLNDNCQVILVSNDFSKIYNLIDANQCLNLVDDLRSLKFNVNSLNDQPSDWDLIDFSEFNGLNEVGVNHFLNPLFEQLQLAMIRIEYK